MVFCISCNRLIGRFLFNYIRNSPITRTDQDDLIIFDEEHVGSRLWYFLYDILLKWVELNIIRYNIADGFRGGVFLLHVRVLKNDFSDDVLLFRCQREARRRSDDGRGIRLCLDTFAPGAQKAISPATAAATIRKVGLRSENAI